MLQRDHSTCVLLAVGLLMSLTNIRGAPRIIASSPLPWLTAATSNDSLFDAIVTAKAGANKSAISQALPYSVLLTNSGPAPIIALTLRFVAMKGGKVSVGGAMMYHNWGGQAILASGQSQVFTPIRRLNNLVQGRPQRPSPPGAMAEESGDLAAYAAADEVRIMVDLVVSADGRTAGPDVEGNLQKTLDQYRSLYDLAEQLQARMQGGQSNAQMADWLEQLAIQPVTSADFYAAVQGSTARSWAASLRAGGRASLEATVSGLTHMTEAKTYRFLLGLKKGELK